MLKSKKLKIKKFSAVDQSKLFDFYKQAFNLRYKVSMDYDFFCRAYNNLVPITSIDNPIVKMEPSFLSGSNISPRQFYEPIEIGFRFCPLQVLRHLPLYLIIYFIRLLKVKNLLKTLDNLKYIKKK